MNFSGKKDRWTINGLEEVEGEGTAYEKHYLNGELQSPVYAQLIVYGSIMYGIYLLFRTAYSGYEVINGVSPWLWWSLATLSVVLSIFVGYCLLCEEETDRGKKLWYYFIGNAVVYGLILFIIGFIANDYSILYD